MGYKQYCKDYEKIENYEKAKADNFKGWHCHHRLETHTSDGEHRPIDITRDELRALRMYYGRPASELIFLTRSEHRFLHQKGKHLSEESKNKMSEAMKGEKNPFYGKRHSEEAKLKISEAKKGNTNVRGKRWFNNGKISKRAYECPEGFVPGRIKKALSNKYPELKNIKLFLF